MSLILRTMFSMSRSFLQRLRRRAPDDAADDSPAGDVAERDGILELDEAMLDGDMPDEVEGEDDAEATPLSSGPSRFARLLRRGRGKKDSADSSPEDDTPLEPDSPPEEEASSAKPKRKKGRRKKGARGSTGVVIGEERVTVCRSEKKKGATDPADGYPFAEGGLTELLRELVADGIIKGRVICSLDARQILSTTKPLDPQDEAVPASEIIMRDVGKSMDGGVVADREAVRLPRGNFGVFSVCPGELASDIWRGLSELKPEHLRLVSSDVAFLAAARAIKSSPRRWRHELRLFLSEGLGLALLISHGHIIANRVFVDSPESPERMFAVEVVLNGLRAWVRESFGLDRVDGMVVHTDGTPLLVEDLGTSLGIPVIAADPLRLDRHGLAQALRGFTSKRARTEVDLFRELHPPAGLKDNFPTRACALLGVVLVSSSWLLWDEATKLEGELEAIDGQLTALSKRLDTDLSAMKKIHTTSEIEWATVESFLTERVFWSEVFDALPDILPEGVVLSDVNGRDRLVLKKGAASTSQAPRQMTLTATVEVSDENVSPPEIGVVTDRLRAAPVFMRNFPRITGANVKMMPGAAGTFARLSFVCLPGR